MLRVAAYHQAEHFHSLEEDTPPPPLVRDRRIRYCARTERLGLAHRALAAIRMAEDNAAEAIRHMKSIVALRSRVVVTLAALALDRPIVSGSGGEDGTAEPVVDVAAGTAESTKKDEGSPFVVPPLPADQTGANEPSKDAQLATKNNKSSPPMANKYLHGIQWTCTEVPLHPPIRVVSADQI